MSRLRFVIISAALCCNLVVAAPSVEQLVCYEAFGALPLPSFEHTRKVKTPSFPRIDPRRTKRFEAGLSYLKTLTRPTVFDQCQFSCGPYATAGYYNYVWQQQVEDPVSGAYLTATTFLVKLRMALVYPNRQVRVGTVTEDERAVEDFGLVTEALYPSRPDIDTERLATILNGLANSYWQAAHDDLTPHQRDSLRQRYEEIATEVVQTFFGAFPRREDFSQVSYDSPFHLRDLLKQHFGTGDAYEISSGEHKTKTLLKGPVLASLQQGWPIILSYSYVHTHLSPDGMYLFPPPSERELLSHRAVIDGIAASPDGVLLLRLSNSHADAPTLWLPANLLDSMDWVMQLTLPRSEKQRWKDYL